MFSDLDKRHVRWYRVYDHVGACYVDAVHHGDVLGKKMFHWNIVGFSKYSRSRLMISWD